ncbi:MAG: HK97 family phage prohead protease [Robiginitomaculum sp.]|nr:MAG: HK97 family phage prohead protease [Robiginitomaculum sp.]
MLSAHVLRVSGYASVFGVRDLGGDIVHRGAFASSLLQRVNSTLPMLFAHETKEPVGVWNRVFEDKSGLFVSGEIFLGTDRSDRIARLVKSGALSGLSIGYKPVRVRRQKGERTLLEVDLWEVSIVAFPMLRAARITQIDDPQTVTETSRRSML